jgi:3-oxoacyl-[acyl-carrier protein] reductase
MKVSPETPWESGCALVTGASRGIGAAIALALAEQGWPVAINFRADETGASEIVARIEANGGRALAVRGDVSDPDSVDAVFTTLEESFGRVLVLVNNAGTRRDQLMAMLPDEDWSTVLDVNMSAAFRTMRRAIGPMIRAKFGRIINVSSISAGMPLPGQLSYAASKAGLEAMTRTAAVEVARKGVTVNAIAPGLVETELTVDIDPRFRLRVPARRAGLPEEIAWCARFLASPGASYVTGSTLVVDGGLTAGMTIDRSSNGKDRQSNGKVEAAAEPIDVK